MLVLLNDVDYHLVDASTKIFEPVVYSKHKIGLLSILQTGNRLLRHPLTNVCHSINVLANKNRYIFSAKK